MLVSLNGFSVPEVGVAFCNRLDAISYLQVWPQVGPSLIDNDPASLMPLVCDGLKSNNVVIRCYVVVAEADFGG
eukprot:1604175-Pyramimonas_sp.AAC.1